MQLDSPDFTYYTECPAVTLSNLRWEYLKEISYLILILKWLISDIQNGFGKDIIATWESRVDYIGAETTWKTDIFLFLG